MEEAVRADPATTNHYAFLGGGDGYHRIVRDGVVEGYLCIDASDRVYRCASDHGMPFGFVSRVSVRTREAALAAIKRLAELTGRTGADRVTLIESHQNLATQTMLSLGGSYQLRGSSPLAALDGEMVAIIDLARVCGELAPELQRRQSALGSTDAGFSLEMSGEVVSFVSEAGSFRIGRQKARHHRLIPRWVMTRLVMGYYSGSDILAMGAIPWDRANGKEPDDRSLDMQAFTLPDPEALLFSRLFPKLWPCASPDPDVWPWIQGKEPPRYRRGTESLELRSRIDAFRFPWVER